MSRHWKPPSGKIVRIRPVGRRRDWLRLYWPEAARRRIPDGGKAGLVLVAAACVGVAIGAYQVLGPRDIVADEVAAPRKVESVAPAPVTDAKDQEWAERGKTGLPRGAAARSDEAAGVRVAFGYCKWGGGLNCVVDGDTIYLNGAKIRIAGIDAPETHDYRCGSELALGERAARRLQDLLNSGPVTLSSIDRDRDVYGRLLRNVAVNGQDVGDALISEDLARRYAGGRRPWC
jgi:endonuclease YncB( thermonuclease family)